MSVWFCIPSARPSEQVEPVLAQWRERGYKIALWLDNPRKSPHYDHFNWAHFYPGYAKAVNQLAHEVMIMDSSCDWIVTGGDDTLPDPNHTAEEIAQECSAYFLGVHLIADLAVGINDYRNATLGVMQPTGDRFAQGSIDRIAGSPWIGREWCLRANGGRGPFWPEFTHMFGDECLKRTAEKLGVYWARPDLTHKHMHYQRESDAIDSNAIANPVPPHLEKWNTKEHWEEMKAIFKRLEAEDFVSCLPK
jgi:hypothetical protein